jgi:hypothetical protein
MIVGLDFNFVRLLDKIELNVYVNELNYNSIIII